MNTDELFLYDRSGTRYAFSEKRWRGDDGSPLAVSPLRGLTRDDVDTAEHSLWRYQRAIPVKQAFRVSLGEGFTPMPSLKWRDCDIHFKLEWFNPTSSFKDRGVSVMISHLRSQGCTSVLEDSSGNGGSSVAAFAAAAGMSAKVLMPEGTSRAKTLQVEAFGAEVEFVAGSRDDVADEAVRQASSRPYASHNWHPLFLHGTKTIGYEIWESLGWRAPDNIVMVAGAGSALLGCELAFEELLASGAVTHRPRLFVGQPEDWSAIACELNGLPPTPPERRQPTIAEGASIARPVRLPETVAALRRSGGGAVALTESEISDAVKELAHIGLYVEPTSAVAAGALNRFVAHGDIKPEHTTAVVLSGTGLKSASMPTIFSAG